MHIVLPVHHFPPRYVAGAELYTYRLARHLQQLGHRVDVICVESVSEGTLEPQCVSEEYEGIPVHRLLFNLALAPDPRRWEFWNPQLGEWFGRFLEEHRPDLVHLQGGYLLTGSVARAAQAAGLPVILTLHDFWFLCPRIHLQRPDGTLCEVPDDPAECAWCLLTEKRRYRLPDRVSRGLVGRLAQNLLRPSIPGHLTGWSARVETMHERRQRLAEVLHAMDLLIVPSRFLERIFIQRGGVVPDLLYYSRYGLDDMWAQPPARLDSPNGRLRIGYIGQIAPHKGVHVLLKAVRQLENADGPWELRIYGDTTRFPQYAQHLRRLAGGHPHIRFEGQVENRHIPAVLADLDVLVVPSLWYENAPLTILEAHAAGVPVIASDLGGMAEMVRDPQDGLRFRPGDDRDLARQIRQFLDEPDFFTRLRRGIRPERLIRDEVAELLTVYRQILEGR